MPEYLFQHPKTQKVISVVQSMNDSHVYVDENGVEWKRVFVNPTVSIDTSSDPFSESAFIDSTKNKNYTIGDLWDKSKEMSQKREKRSGRDEVKQKAVDKYEKKCKKDHPLKNV